jgi:hypothetical protein
MIEAGEERVHAGDGPGFADAVTFAFADPRAGLYGFLRLVLAPPRDARERPGSAAAVLLSREGVLASAVASELPVPADSGWESFALGGVAAIVDTPLERWSAALMDPRTGGGAELDYRSLGAAVALAHLPGDCAGYAELCAVRGGATVAGRRVAVDCLGWREHVWGDPGPDRSESAAVWLDDRTAFAIRTRGGGEPAHVTALGRPARFARGRTLCRSTLELGSGRLELAFVSWTVDGRPGGLGYTEVRVPAP